MTDVIKVTINGANTAMSKIDAIKSLLDEATRQATVQAAGKLQAIAVSSFNSPPAPFTRTGNLQRSIKQGTLSSVGLGRYSIQVSPQAIYARIQEYGGTIVPRQAKMLSWVGPDGKRVFARKVTIRPHPYFHPAVQKMRGDMTAIFSSAWRKAFHG